MDLKQKLVVVKFRHRVTKADIERYAARLRGHPSFDESFSEIVDLSAVEQIDLSADEFLKLADKVDPFSFDSRRAFGVITPTQARAARMHELLRGLRTFEIFHWFEEAEQWIRKSDDSSEHPH